MANFSDLLGSFMQTNMAQSAQGRLGNVFQDLQANLGNVASGQGGASGMLGSLLEQAKSTLGNASQNPLQAGGLGAVLGSVLGGGGDSLKGAVTGGALAMLAGVAYKALTSAGQNAKGEQAPVGQAQFSGGSLPLGLKIPDTDAEQHLFQTKAQLIIKGMINIAKSDGQVSPDEVQRIVSKVQAAGMDAEAQQWLMAEFQRPFDLDAFVAEIPNQEIAAEVYAASLLAVEVDTQAEKDYLQQFAQKTGLNPLVVQTIHQTLGVVA